MTPQPPPLAPFRALLRKALSTASRRVVQGSRRNAGEAATALRTTREEAA